MQTVRVENRGILTATEKLKTSTVTIEASHPSISIFALVFRAEKLQNFFHAHRPNFSYYMSNKNSLSEL